MVSASFSILCLFVLLLSAWSFAWWRELLRSYKLHSFEDILMFLFNYRDIEKDGSLYMRRWYLVRTKPFAIFLHKIYRGDEDRHLHDHPWPFAVLLLKGSYVEEVPDERYGYEGAAPRITRFVWRGPFSFRRMKSTQLHRLHLDRGPVWSLFMRGREHRTWGFATIDGEIPWYVYLQENKEQENEQQV